MKNPPYMPLYVRDWLSDSHVRRMTYEEKGVFVELLMFNWEDDGLPAEIDELARLCKLPVVKFKKLWSRLKRHFVDMVRDDVRLLYSKKLLDLRETKEPGSSGTSDRHRKAALARWHPEDSEKPDLSKNLACKTDAKAHAKLMQYASDSDVVCDASHAGTPARNIANVIANAVEDCGVDEGGCRGETNPTAPNLNAKVLANRFVEVRQKVIGIKPREADSIAFVAIFEEVLAVAEAEDIDAVLMLLADKSGKKHWTFGLGHMPDSKKTHPFLKQFGSLLADAGDKGFRTIDEPVEVQVIATELPDFDPIAPQKWENAIHGLGIELDKEVMECWITSLRPLGRFGDEIWIAAPNQFNRGYVAGNYRDMLSLHLQSAVRIVTMPEATA